MSKTINVKVPIEMISPDAAEIINQLQKKIRSLENKLKRRDARIAALESGMDLTKERRDEIRQLATKLVNALKASEWVEIDEYYEDY